MSTDQTIDATAELDANAVDTTATVAPDLSAEDLIEEVSIDGMCGVY